MRTFRLLAALATVAVVAALPAAQAAPTCPEAATRPACGGRVLAPPLQTATFLQYGREYKPALDAIEAINPDVIDVLELGKSKGGRDIWIVRLTDETETGPKRQVAVSISVHANEAAGREGGLRYVEDLVRWSVDDPDHPLYAGDTAVPLDAVLDETEIYVAVLNVDGWAVGDAGGSGPIYSRGNSSGQDLNRDFPTIGWTKRTQATEPETQAWIELVESMPNLTTATDIHGELTSATSSFADIMYPAGQWDPQRQAQELQFAEHMKRSVERKFAEEGVVLQTLFDLLGEEERPMKPAEYATAYDIVGYDDSGFMGDWFAAQGAVELDVENFLSHLVPSNIWFAPLEQAHVAAVKGQIEAVIAESMITDEVEVDLDLGDVAYVVDPALVERTANEDEAGYSVTRMRYFTDLAEDAGVEVAPIAAADVATADLSAFDSLVLADLTVPADPQGRPVDRAAYVAALDAFARGGGQLVLTDRAIELLPELGAVAPGTVRTAKTNAGHVTFGALDHPWERELTETASQTYYEVPLGYTASRQAPHVGIDTAAFTAAGGTSVGTVDGSFTNLGELPHGTGSIAIFGAILPTQTQDNRHDHGLADYAVTVAGGQVLHAILGYTR